jgi:hypothetical protein
MTIPSIQGLVEVESKHKFEQQPSLCEANPFPQPNIRNDGGISPPNNNVPSFGYTLVRT